MESEQTFKLYRQVAEDIRHGFFFIESCNLVCVAIVKMNVIQKRVG